MMDPNFVETPAGVGNARSARNGLVRNDLARNGLVRNGLARRPGARAVPTGTVIRVGVAMEIPGVLRELGVEPQEVQADVGVDPRLFEDAENLIPVATLGRLVGAAVARTHCSHFGLLVGQKAGLSALGIIGLLMQHALYVGEALRELVAHLHLHDRAAVPTLSVDGETATLTYAMVEPGVECAEQICDAAMATACNIMRQLCGRGWAATEVYLPRRAPEDASLFRRFFKAPVRFDAEAAALVFPSRWLEQPLPTTDPVLGRILRERIEELERRETISFSGELRRLLRTRVTTKNVSAEDVAKLFGMHRRTMNRRLAAEATSFKRVADEVRYEVARQLIANTEMTFAQIAAVLNFSEAGAFTRAFRRWSGDTPTSSRDAHIWSQARR